MVSNTPDATRFYINGSWVEPASDARLDVIDPSKR